MAVAGSYIMTLTAINTVMPGVDPGGTGMQEVNFCDRNVDAIVLHPNATDVELRMKFEAPFLPLDGLMQTSLARVLEKGLEEAKKPVQQTNPQRKTEKEPRLPSCSAHS